MEHRARKRFGQNFLTCQNTIFKIIQAIRPNDTDKVIEIGPGLGALTFELLKHLNELTVIEIDNDLVRYLNERQATIGEKKLNIIHQDVLTVDISAIGFELKIIGNLPYNISTAVLFHLIKHRAAINCLCFMLQKEVVDRICAEPNTKAYGRLSVMLQYYFHTEALFTIPPDAFKPKPKVMSKIVRLMPHFNPYPNVCDKTFEKLIRMAFAHRRKTLKKNLQGLIDESVLKALDIDPQRRPETLSVHEYVSLCQQLCGR